MNYLKISRVDTLNGMDIGVVLWVAGCTHHCPQCHNPSSWDKTSGSKFTEDTYKQLLEELKKPYYTRLTISGGDPLAIFNRDEVLELTKHIKQDLPHIKIWLYTGYLYDEVKEYLPYVDTIVDGKFKIEEKDTSLYYRGSRNQRIIDVRSGGQYDFHDL